jgi:TolB-like protein
MSNDAENEYFSDGIAEELINTLSKIDGLQLTCRTSSFSFKGKNQDVREIGKALNVNKILEGSVRKSGSRVRITAELVNTADGYQLWSKHLTEISMTFSNCRMKLPASLQIVCGSNW